jgi:hypothetical protein
MPNSLNSRAMLAEISANYTPGKELSPSTRNIIIGLALGGENPSQIARQLKLPRSTVCDQITLWDSRDQCQSQPRSGRPKVYDARDERRIIRLVCQNPKLTWQKTMESLNLAIL